MASLAKRRQIPRQEIPLVAIQMVNREHVKQAHSLLRKARNASKPALSPTLTPYSSVADNPTLHAYVPHRSQVPHLKQRPLTSCFPQYVHVSSEFMRVTLVLLE
jgi:hypothetical protein